jgi:hypothetical protein
MDIVSRFMIAPKVAILTSSTTVSATMVSLLLLKAIIFSSLVFLERQNLLAIAILVDMSEGVITHILLNVHSPDIHGLDTGLGVLVRIQSNPHLGNISLVHDSDRLGIQQNGRRTRRHQIYLRRPRAVVVELHGNIIGRLEVLLFARTGLSSLYLEAGFEQSLSHLDIGNDNVTASLAGTEAILCRVAGEVGFENEFSVVNNNQSGIVHDLQFSFYSFSVS